MARIPSPEMATPQEGQLKELNAASSDAFILSNTEMQRSSSQSSTRSISSAALSTQRAPVKPFGSSSSSGPSARLPATLGTASPFVQQHQQQKEEQAREAAEKAAREAQCARDEELAKAFAAPLAGRKARRTSKPIIPDFAEPDDAPAQRPVPPRRRSSAASRSAPTAPSKPTPFHISIPTLHSPAPTSLQSRSPSVNPPPVAVAPPSSPQAGPGPKTQAKHKLDFAVEIPAPKKQKKVDGDSPKQHSEQPKHSAALSLAPGPPSAPAPAAEPAAQVAKRPTAADKPSATPPQATRLQNRPCGGFNVMKVACTSCAAGLASQCSFRHRRTFPVLDHHRKSDVDNPLFLPASDPDDIPRLPTEYSTPFTEHHAALLKTTVAHGLANSIAVEEAHARRAGCVKQRLVLKDHNTCDGCLTTIFNGSWLCRHCGREICLDCATALERCHQAPSTKAEMEQRTRLMKCAAGREVHGGVDLEETGDHVPMTRLSKEELERMRKAMEAWKEDHPAQEPPALPQELLDHLYTSDPDTYSSPADTCRPYLRIPVGLLDRADPRDVASAKHPVPQPPTSFTDSVLADLDSMDCATLFHLLWSRGETMVVELDLSRHFPKEWSPERFIQSHGDKSCTIASNTGGADVPSTVREFFRRFLEFYSSEDGESLKLKDFPPTKDFKKELLDLFYEFMNALPAGIVTRRDGPLNIAAHSPVNSNVPDLGPKGYWSQISNDAPGGQGSTKLHMDLADACNVSLWSSPKPDGSPGLAAWDIFRAEDSEKIRDFLYEHKTKLLRAQTGQDELSVDDVRAVHDDPIHSQEFFLDSNLRAELLKEKGVKSWRIWQRPGQVVFIPAGCAHQVCNFAHCIKIAVDFVSRENVSRCWKVTDEFREQTKGRELWREDVLQLKNQLFWAWKSCERFDLGKSEQDQAKAGGAAEKGDDEVRAMAEDV